MAGREVTLTVFLTDEDLAVLARKIQDMNEWQAQQQVSPSTTLVNQVARQAPPWDEQRVLASMIFMSFSEMREQYRRDDLWAADLLRRPNIEEFPADIAAVLDQVADELRQKGGQA